MTRAIRIPFIADVLIVDRPGEVGALGRDERLDRNYAGKGPLLNRLQTGRLRTVLRVGTRLLPSAVARADPQRRAEQAALEARLDRGGPPDPAIVGALAEAVRGLPGAHPLGPAAQQAVGRMFSATYRADDASWAAAVDLDAAARAGVLSYLRLRITGRLKQAQTLLGARVHGDLAGVHATGIAVHTLVHALERMRSLWSDTSGKPRPSAEQALAHSLRPPQRILRQAVAGGDSPAGALHAGGLAVLELEQAYAADPRPEIAFMSGTWSRCPAAAAVPRLLAQVWETAIADDAKPGPWFGPAEGLRLGWSEAQSVDQQHAYRRVAGLVLLLQFAAAAVLLLAPSWAAALAGVQAAPGWQRFGGGLMLTWLLYAAPALIAPLQSRLANFATAAAAVLVGAFACAVGGRLLWVGLAEALLGLVLAWRYWRLLVAELMSRP